MKKEYQTLLSDLSDLIEKSRNNAVSYANSSLTILFWHIGKKIRTHILLNKRAEYGKQVVKSISYNLEKNYGRNFEEKNLRRMIQFSELYPDIQIVVTLSRQLSWSHFITLLPIRRQQEREFYSSLAFDNAFGVRELKKQIVKKVYERIENADVQVFDSKKIEKGVFKDPYLLDFLGLRDGYLEHDLESAILKKLELFILELGHGFTFIERQKRMIIDGEDYNLDLLFYHRKLKRLVAIELKTDKFRAKYKGQMELYLKWLDKYEKQDGEETPIGLILCTLTSKEQVELLEMQKEGIMVSEYWTELPAKKILEAKLHSAVIEAKENLERKFNRGV